MTACAGCGTALAADAKFCAVCGRPSVAMAAGAGAATAPPMPPPMPQMPNVLRAPGVSGGTSKQATLNGAPHDVFARALQVLGAENAELTWQQPPQGAKFVLTRKSMWSTAGTSIKYDGDLQVTPAGPAQSTARIALKLQWGSAMPLLALQGGAVVVAAMFNYYIAAFALIFIIGFLAITAWSVSSGIPEKALTDMMRVLQGGAPVAAPAPAYAAPAPAPSPAAYSPPAQPAPQPAAAPAQAAPTQAEAAAIIEQIKQVASLRDAGAITPEEFEAKKKELLARI
jgi:hypothetical protein